MNKRGLDSTHDNNASSEDTGNEQITLLKCLPSRLIQVMHPEISNLCKNNGTVKSVIASTRSGQLRYYWGKIGLAI